MYFSDGGHENVFLATFLLRSPWPKRSIYISLLLYRKISTLLSEIIYHRIFLVTFVNRAMTNSKFHISSMGQLRYKAIITELEWPQHGKLHVNYVYFALRFTAGRIQVMGVTINFVNNFDVNWDVGKRKEVFFHYCFRLG